MNSTIQELQNRGCDIASAMERFLNDEEFYMQCYEQVVVDPNFENLQETLKAKDAKAAFEAAHSLKGVIANMGLTPLYNVVVEIVEPLRQGNCEGLEGKCQELLTLRDSYKELIK